MGRPINDKFFVGDLSDNTGGKPGLQVRVLRASFTGGPSDVSTAWIIRQRNPDGFEITDGENTEVLRSYNGAGEVPSGRFSLAVVPYFDQSTEYMRTFSSHVVKTFQGNTYSWTNLQKGNAASAVGEVDFSPVMQ